MYKLQHFIAKHKLASFLTITIIVCMVYTSLLMQLNVPTWGLILVNLVLGFIVYAYVEYSADPIMKKASQELDDNCNPYPLLEETEKLLSYKNSEVVKQIILINHAVALRSIGDYQRNLDTLQALNIDKKAGMLPMNKVVYYNNLMDACGLLGKYEEADVWYSKMMLIHADITNQKQLESLEYTMQMAKVFHFYCNQDYEKALQLMQEIRPKTNQSAVEHAISYARIAIALEDRETAKQKLEFVVENGNLLYAVTEAKQMLGEI